MKSAIIPIIDQNISFVSIISNIINKKSMLATTQIANITPIANKNPVTIIIPFLLSEMNLQIVPSLI